jgi:hypothetical protein
MMFLKAIHAWMVIVLAETMHGILRVVFLTPRLGDKRARQLGVLTGSVIILSIGWWMVPWVLRTPAVQVGSGSIVSPGDTLAVGALWVTLMIAFELLLGRVVFSYSWQRMAEDYDIRQGGFLGLGMMVLLLTPRIVAKHRGLL